MNKVDTDQLLSDSLKLEGPWTEEIENLIKQWKTSCLVKSKQHEKAGYIFKKKSVQWGLPPVLIPIIMSPVSAMIGYDNCGETAQWKNIVTSSAFLISGLFAGVSSFFRYSEKTEKFFNYATRYADIATEIDSELIKSKEYRVPADVFLTRVKMLIDNVSKSEPTLPESVLENKED
jgi:hypothetical protein